jgi:hypothetical protein
MNQVKPRDIDLSSGKWNKKNVLQNVIKNIVSFSQVNNKWIKFSFDDYKKKSKGYIGKRDENILKYLESYFGLLSMKEDNKYEVNIKFYEFCIDISKID